MYIMCVCLFSALSRRVGALQISVIIIIINTAMWTQDVSSVNVNSRSDFNESGMNMMESTHWCPLSHTKVSIIIIQPVQQDQYLPFSGQKSFIFYIITCLTSAFVWHTQKCIT